VDVRALYDADRLGLLIEWVDAARDVDLGTALQFRDGAAIQFPEGPSFDSASFMMGQEGAGVVIYHWKSDWPFGRSFDIDEAYPNMYADWYPYSGVPVGEIPENANYLSDGLKGYLTAAAAGNAIADPLVQEKVGPILKMRAEGFGTLEPAEAQDVGGMGVWREGRWRVAISLPWQHGNFNFGEGNAVPFAFAVWDGSRNERNGQKAFSLWHDLSLSIAPVAAATPASSEDNGTGGDFPVPLPGSIGGVAVAAAAALIGFRMWRGRQRPRE